MNIFNLANNALFLRNWRERMRGHVVLSALILTGLVIGLIVLNAMLNETYIYMHEKASMHTHSERVLFPWPKKILFDLCSLQAFIILFFGTVSAYRFASQERTSGTLDFHRSSPTPVAYQTMGLLLGSASLEWCLFFGVLMLQWMCAFVIPVNIGIILEFNFEIFLCAILFHSIAILVGIARSARSSRGDAVALILGIYIVSHILIATQHAFFYHLTWIPAFDQLSLELRGNHYRYIPFKSHELLGMLFGHRYEPLILYIVSQVPIILFIYIGIMRKISEPEHPFLSKGQTLLLSLYVFFLFVGGAITHVFHNFGYYPIQSNVSMLIFLIFIIGFVSVMLVTPTQLFYMRGLSRCRKLELKRMESNDDQNSNVFWLVVYALIVIIVLQIFAYILKALPLINLLLTLIILNHLIFFSQFVEYFRLSKFNQKRGFFVTVLILFWIILPMFGKVVKSVGNFSRLDQILGAPSPFFATSGLIQGLMGETPIKGKTWILSEVLPIIFVITLIMAILATMFASKERKRLRKEVFEDS